MAGKRALAMCTALAVWFDGGSAVADTGLLTNTARDWIAIAGALGTIATIAGLLLGWVAFRLTIMQVRQSADAASRAATVAEAAKDAAVQATTELRAQYDRYLVIHAGGLLKEAKIYAHNEEWVPAALRAVDLAELFEQISNDDDLWKAFARNLRVMESSFTRISKKEIGYAGIKSKWNKLHSEISANLAQHYSPFSVPKEEISYGDYRTASGDVEETSVPLNEQ